MTALARSRRRASLLSISGSPSRVAQNRRSGGRGGMRRGGGVLGAQPLVRFVGGGGTFTRATEASYYTAPPNTAGGFLSWAGNDTIREDKRDGVSGLYLFEAPQTNLCLYSEALDDASWAKTGATVGAGVTTAPDGQVDCKTVTFTAAATDKVTRTIAGTADATFYVTTVWVRRPSGPGNVRLSFLLRDATAPITVDKAVGTTWTRIEDLRNWGTGATVPAVGVQNDAAGTAQPVEVWGFDVKSNLIGGSAFNAPSSYVRTTNLAVLRAGDDMTWPVTPTAMLSGRTSFRFSPIYGTGEANSASAYYTIGNATYNGQDSRPGIGVITEQVANVWQFSSNGITFGRNVVMTAESDRPAAHMTVTGAATGNGTGPQGIAVTQTQAALYCGRYALGPLYYANARIGEPYALAPTVPFDVNSVSGLVIDINPALDSAGAVTSILDRQNGYIFNGTITRDAAINGTPTYTGNGTSDILTSTAAISQLAGVQAITVIMVIKDAFAGAAVGVVMSLGASSVIPSANGIFEASVNGSAAVVTGTAGGNVGYNQHSIAETLAAGIVYTQQNDFSAPSPEVTFRRNGSTVAGAPVITANNTGVFGSYPLDLFARNGPTLFWPGSSARALVYNRALSAGEMQSIERALGLKAGILVA